MLILIDREALKMVAAASSRKWINLVHYVDFPNVASLIVDSEEGRTWTELSQEELATLFKNMSGQDAPEYRVAIEQLRSYSSRWPEYPKSERQLEVEAEAIFQQEQAEGGDEPPDDRYTQTALQQAHQAAIKQAEAANPSKPLAERASEAPTKAEAKPKASGGDAPPRQGITKRIWEIADARLAVHGTISNIKEFRKEVIDLAAAEGANSGTAATQFGKWKASKGL